MKSIFEEMGGTYRQVDDYFIHNITLPYEQYPQPCGGNHLD